MWKVLYEIITNPLGLPINIFYEYLILFAVGEIAHIIAWNISPGGEFGSFIYWFTKGIVFIAMWAVTYSIIWIINCVIKYYIWFILIIGLASLIATILFIIAHKKKEKQQK